MKTWKITLFGKGGHGAEPHETIDATIMLAEFIRLVNSKNIEVLSSHSGDAFNVISGVATATVLAQDDKIIRETAEHLLTYYGDECRYEIEEI